VARMLQQMYCPLRYLMRPPPYSYLSSCWATLLYHWILHSNRQMKEGRYNLQSWVQQHIHMPVVQVLHIYKKHSTKVCIPQQSIFGILLLHVLCVFLLLMFDSP